jgi:CubicO group peptidase (beta-lactamase class C family)
MRVFRAPLPSVLRARVLDPIGASRQWEWHGYDDAWVTVDGLRMASVTGGSHWGAGMMIDSFDLARFGLLHLMDGVWEGRRVLPEGWVRQATSPSACKPDYGLLWWLNTGRVHFPRLPANAFWAAGAGGHLVFVAPDQRSVVVTRWLARDVHEEFLSRVLAALDG